MIEVGAFKYWTSGKYSDPVTAQEEVDRLRERHPDRDYTLLINMRSSYKRYVVAQYKMVTVQWPEGEDVGLPEPEAPAKTTPWSSTVWADYRHEYNKWTEAMAKHIAPVKRLLNEKLNP